MEVIFYDMPVQVAFSYNCSNMHLSQGLD